MGVSSHRPTPTRRRSVRQAFVVSPARSGSTLLRYLLDSHPDIVSPPELNLSALLQHLADVWTQTELALGVGKLPPDPNNAAPLSAEVCRRARRPVDALMLSCANAAGASIYCDKSLTTVDHLATITQCYPQAPLIFLYRYPLDMIASGLEASRWGFNAFGFAPYVSAAPGNFIGGLANYWIDKVSKMLGFERSFSGPHARIYYELLCDEPASTLDTLFEFMGLAPEPAVIDQAFASHHGRGPGDYKIDYTGSISVESIGRGSTLPQNMNSQQVSRINELLAELDYPELEAARKGDLGALLGLKGAPAARRDGTEIARLIAELLSQPGNGEVAGPYREVLPIELVVTRAGLGEPARVLVESDARAVVLNGNLPESSQAVPRIECVSDVVLRVVADEVSFGKAVRDGEIRVDHASAEESDRAPHELLAALSALIRARG